MQVVQQSIRIYLRSALQTYEELKKCEMDVLELIDKEFNGQLTLMNDTQSFVRTLWLTDRAKPYSSWIHRAEKYLTDIVDLHESLRKVKTSNERFDRFNARLGSATEQLQSHAERFPFSSSKKSGRIAQTIHSFRH
jgi:DNA repair ATPase RecN